MRLSPSLIPLVRLRLALLCAIALLPIGLWSLSPLVSTAAAPRTLNQVQSQIQTKQRQIDRKKGSEKVLTGTISGYSARISKLQSKITTLQGQQTAVQADLDAKRAELSKVQGDLRTERARLTRLRQRLIAARAALEARLVELYKSDRPDLMTLVLSSKGFADLFERSEFLRRISDSDKRIVATVRDAKAEATATTTRLSALEKREQVVAAAIMQRRDEIVGVKAQLVDTRSGYEATRSSKQNVLSKVRTQRKDLQDDVEVLQAAQAKIQARLAAVAAGGDNTTLPVGAIKQGSGGLIWPVNGPITSPFCESRSWESCHPGIDIGVPTGTPIRSAANGRVVLMQPESASGGYGNFTCVQHTSTMSTCYAHQSQFATSMGAQVSQGDVIGYVGCTGRCYGDHLHFEVRINGAVTNPLNYL
ncbi:MAG: peptidoglycan DD-metalloendopeptidase family protein [Solirubrobacterales bacterium]|nr:peptidoglycan DD-metalloendopeptidase family protein [Solirubrobacterales bacterium]